MEQSYDHTVRPLAECMLLQRVTLTGISEARLRFLYPHYSRVRVELLLRDDELYRAWIVRRHFLGEAGTACSALCVLLRL
jgi:hypothetical protein